MPVLPPNMQSLLRGWFRGTANFPNAPVQLWLALHTTAPTGDSGGAEVSGGGYARLPITVGSGFADYGAGAFTNAIALTFPAATADWGSVVGWSLMSALTAGTRRAFGRFGTTVPVTTGKVLTIDPGALVVDFTAV
jgi:hypothetical protein